MSDHNSAVFAHSCLKTPVNPLNRQPFPVCDQKYINYLEDEVRKLSVESNEFKMKSVSASEIDKSTIKSFIEFYDSIPDYNDIHHLSNKDFYRKLEALKEKQRNYYDYVRNQDKYSPKEIDWIEDYKNLIVSVTNVEDAESIISSDKDIKPPSRRSVRIETPSDKLFVENSPELSYFRPKSRANVSSAGSRGFNNINDSFWDDLSFDDCCDGDQNLTTRSAPNSPSKSKPNVGWKDGITIPRPFEMTVRDEEIKIIDGIMLKTNKPATEKHDMFRAHPVPIESQIPLFDKIMCDQERRRQKIKRRSKAALQAQMRPFSFTRRDEEIQAINKRLSKSSPCVFLDEPIVKTKPFKAKPIPKNLFSNYIYRKMHEDEFYRALQRKVRAEEMLRAASLPPSMALREKKKPKPHLCPRSYRDFNIDEDMVKQIMLTKNNSKCKPQINDYIDRELRELEKLESEFIRRNPKCHKNKRRSKVKRGRQSSAESKSTIRSTPTLDMVHRSNLAAVLRVQSARKRIEMDLCKKVEEAKLREETRWREKVLRKRPVWQELAYSNEEDLAMRLQMRRDEERLRNEEHKHRMQLMLGRVNQQPTLFERQSQVLTSCRTL
ncbi:hypothetical protein MML48_2g00009547 [Holotrichia oblita]|uniref:Uncharacterized protein n=1 Tax=Holotrichia oblita TaxID=644536 RepID=A0ACB9TMA8_HOLOL|nr:hypothetical protein MML48_2g00009547 [Holotrichia oblita]